MACTLWNIIDNTTYVYSEILKEKTRDRHNKKFEKIKPKNTTEDQPKLDGAKIMVNLSGTTVRLLKKGDNYAVTPRVIPTKEITTEIEGATRHLPSSDADEVRVETIRILKKAKPPKPNIIKKKLIALRDLRKNKNLKILNKGNATVVMQLSDYRRKVEDILSEGNYKEITKNPKSRIERISNTLLKKTNWEPEIIKKLLASDIHCPRFYGLPKIHKVGIPLQPILSAIKKRTHSLAKHLAQLLKPFVEN